MIDKLIISTYWMAFIVTIFLISYSSYEDEQLNRGKAISQFVAYYHDIDMTPQEARWLVPVVTTYNIEVTDLDIIMPYAPIQHK